MPATSPSGTSTRSSRWRCGGAQIDEAADVRLGDGLDGDVLIAAQAPAESAAVATTNTRHFEGLVETFTWETVPIGA